MGRHSILTKKTAPYVFILPFFILTAVFSLYPYLFALYTSFFRWAGFGEMQFIGFQNYVNIIKDTRFFLTLKNVFFIFFMNVPFMVFTALVFAAILSVADIRFRSSFRAILYMPNITNIIAVSYVFSMLIAPTGIFNSILTSIGLNPLPWLGNGMLARLSIAMLTTWRWVGYNTIIMMAGIQGISLDLYDAASIDGSGKVGSFFRITLPLMKPVILFSALMSTIGTVSMFAEPMIMTQGNPMNQTLTPVLYLFKESFQNMNAGYASAMAYAIFIILMILSAIEVRVGRSDY